MRSTALTSARTARVTVAGVLLLGLTACGAPGGGGSTGPSVSTVATSSPTASPASSSSSPPVSGGSAEDSADVLPDALFEKDGMTLLEYSHSSDALVTYIDTAKEDVLEEVVGTDEVQVDVSDVRKGDEFRVQLVCPSGATGKSDIYVSDSPEGERDWKAGSEGMCGDWSAGLPPREEGEAFTITVTVENDTPFRVAVTKLHD